MVKSKITKEIFGDIRYADFGTPEYEKRKQLLLGMGKRRKKKN